MPWKEIEGYKYPYRINEDGTVQSCCKGKWRVLKPQMSTVLRVWFYTVDGKRTSVPVPRLMIEKFLGGKRTDQSVIHKNGSKWDCSLGNLKVVPKREACAISGYARRRTVKKIDRDGNVVAFYKSVAEAAEKNYISREAMRRRCAREVKDPYRLDGYDYQYEETKF